MSLDRRTFVGSSSALLVLPAAATAQSAATVRPEDFGARGDGVTNDTGAFWLMSQHINRAGGGTILLTAGRTYVVGRQSRGGHYAWSPAPIIELKGLSRPLRILGNGARLLAQPGMRFGTFDRQSGEAVHRPMPNFRLEEVASPYQGMIWIEQSRAPIEIRDLELDGNLPRLTIGGRYGDIGWQLPGTGLFLRDNHATESVINVHSHHHPQDGVMIDGADGRSVRSTVRKLVTRFNGRQGLSLVAGSGYDFLDCDFSHSGRSVIGSAPGAGVDIEAERNKPIRDVSFTRCKFVDNRGAGLVADSGDSAGAVFTDCLFVGTDTFSAWPHKPRFVFRNCTFAGTLVHAFPSPDPALATQFFNCRFTDDPSLSPRKMLYFHHEGGGPVVNLAISDNVLFSGCTFDLKHQGVLPWSWRATYQDCTMSQVAKETGMPKGKYLGRTVINGPVDLYNSKILGTVILNGKRVPQGLLGGEAW